MWNYFDFQYIYIPYSNFLIINFYIQHEIYILYLLFTDFIYFYNTMHSKQISYYINYMFFFLIITYEFFFYYIKNVIRKL